MTCGMHEYYLVLHVHIHITSKKRRCLQVMCHGTHFPPDMIPVYDVIGKMLGGQGLEIFKGDVKRWAESHKKW